VYSTLNHVMIERAQTIRDLTTTTDMDAYLIATGLGDFTNRDERFPALFGVAQGQIRELLTIIARLESDLAESDDTEWCEGKPLTDVPMACTVCGKPVERTRGDDGWQHEDKSDAVDCPAVGSVIWARVDA
jgi:hypothetical protein